MLKQRIITALILAPLAIWGILALSHETFRIVLMVIAMMAAWEWARLVGWQQPMQRVGYMTLLLAMIGVLEMQMRQAMPLNWVLFVALLWWCASLVMVMRYPAGSGVWRESALARAMAGIVIIVPMWLGLGVLHTDAGPAYVLVLMLMVWGADTGAYFAGRKFGRHKLAPQVSPGKSWEGVLGGLVTTLLIAALAAWLLQPVRGSVAFMLLAVVTVAISIVGDLQESMFKRIVDLKDSGGLLPGHGGVLDRIDSLTAAAPLFALGAAWLNG